MRCFGGPSHGVVDVNSETAVDRSQGSHSGNFDSVNDDVPFMLSVEWRDSEDNVRNTITIETRSNQVSNVGELHRFLSRPFCAVRPLRGNCVWSSLDQIGGGNRGMERSIRGVERSPLEMLQFRENESWGSVQPTNDDWS